MNKKQIIEALKAAGVPVDETLTVEALKALAAEKGVSLEPAPARKPGSVIVKVKGQPICEDGEHYAKDETFTTTLARAEAISHLVDLVD